MGHNTNEEKIVKLKLIGRIVIPICAVAFMSIYLIIGLIVPGLMVGE